MATPDEIRAKYGLPPSGGATPPPKANEARRPAVQKKLSEIKQEEARAAGDTSEDELRKAFLYEVSKELPVMTSPDVIREETERRLQEKIAEKVPPLYLGGFGAMEYAGAIPLARPQEVPVDKAAAPGILEAMMPQTRVGEAAEGRINREVTAGLFNDVEFNKSIAALPEAEKREHLDFYEAYKAAFKKLKDMNPNSSVEEIKTDLTRQLKDLSENKVKTFTDNPAARMGMTNDPNIRAFQQQVETATFPMFEPGQLALLQNLDRIKRSRAVESSAADTERELRTKGVEVTKMVKRPTGDTGPGGKPLMEEVPVGTGVYRPATETEINDAVSRVKKRETEANALPFYMTDKRDEILKNIEGSAKGGVIFQKEYPTGSTVESPTSWFARAAMTVPNALIGTASEAFTPDEVTAKERAARPFFYRDASAAAYNVAQSRGLMGEIGDLYDFNPDPDMKQYAWIGKAAGFAGDMIGFEMGLIGGTAGALREGAATARAVGALSKSVGAAERVAPVLERAAKAGAKEFLSTIGLQKGSNMYRMSWPGADMIKLGDVRLVYGAQLGDTFRAAAVYEDVVKAERAAGAVESVAHELGVAAARETAPVSKFVKDAESAGPRIFDDLGESGKYFGNGVKEWKEYRSVADATDILRTADTPAALAKAAQVTRPYVSAAVRDIPEVLDTVMRLVTPETKALKLADIYREVDSLGPEVSERFYQAIRDSAAVQTGFTTIDRATKGTDPGKFVVRLTPRTFTTTDAVDGILEAARNTREFEFVQRIAQTPLSPEGKFILAAPETLQDLRRLVLHESTVGSLPRSVAREILQAGAEVTPAHLREIIYSLEDRAALASKSAFKESGLAARGGVTVPGRGKLPLPSTRALSFGDDVGFVNSALNKIWTVVTDSMTKPQSMKRFLNAEQVRIVEDARRAIGAIPKRLESALAAAAGDNIAQKLINLSLRVPAGETREAIRNIEFWKDIAKSSIFGVADRSKREYILGEFTYQDPFAIMGSKGKDALYNLCIKYQKEIAAAGKTAADIEELIPKFIDEARAIVTSGQTKEFGRAAGEIYDLKAKPQEILLGAWARKEAAGIHEGALEKLLSYEPDTLGTFSTYFREKFRGIKNASGADMGTIPMDTVVAKYLLEPGTLNSIEDVLALPGIQKWMADLDNMLGRPGTAEKFLRDNQKALLEDVIETSAALAHKHGPENWETQIEDLEALYKGEASLGEVGGPLGTMISKALQEELGSQPKFAEFVNELGTLAEQEAKGRKSAFYARRVMTSILEAFNNMFYYLLLSINPRFHGPNILTAPLMGYGTTGRVPGLKGLGAEVKRGLRDLTENPSTSVGRLLDRVANAEILDRATVIVDRNGIPYTDAEIYDAAIKSGAFKSQTAANIDSRFLADAQKLAKEVGVVGQLVNIPPAFGEASDIYWRMAYVKDALASGKTMDEALDIGRRSLYDYGAATEFERKYIARKILFYNYFRNSVLQTVKQMLVNPARFARQVRLTQDVSKMHVGEETWDDMRFYTPMDAGISRIVMLFAPEANREGKMVLAPQMPYADAIDLMSGILTMPLDLVRGSPDPKTGERSLGDSYILSKLSPITQNALAMVAGAEFAYDIQVTKNQVPVPHVAIMDDLRTPWGTMLELASSLFNIKVRPQQEGEEGYKGMVYTMSDDDTKKYANFLKATQLVGAKRAFDDFGKIAATLDLFGDRGVATGVTSRTTVGPSEAVGATTSTKAGLGATEAEKKAAEIRAAKLQKEEKERTIRSGLELPPERPL